MTDRDVRNATRALLPIKEVGGRGQHAYHLDTEQPPTRALHPPVGSIPSADGRQAWDHLKNAFRRRTTCITPPDGVLLPVGRRASTTSTSHADSAKTSLAPRKNSFYPSDAEDHQLEEAVRTAVDAHLPPGRTSSPRERRSSSMRKKQIDRPYEHAGRSMTRIFRRGLSSFPAGQARLPTARCTS